MVEMRESRTLARAIFAALDTWAGEHSERGAAHFCLNTSIKNNPCFLVKLSIEIVGERVYPRVDKHQVVDVSSDKNK